MSCLNGLKIITQEEWTFVVAWIMMIRDIQWMIVLHMISGMQQCVPLGVINVWLVDTICEETVSVIRCIRGVDLR